MQIDKIIVFKDGENLIATFRDNWAGRLRGWLTGFGLLSVGFFLMVPLFSMQWFGVIVFVGLIAGGLAVLSRTFAEWRDNVLIVTDRRVIDIDRKGFFDRIVSEAPYDRIQDVSYALKGIGGALLGCGSVTVRTGVGAIGLEISFVKDPRLVHHVITEALAIAQGTVSAPSAEARVGAIMDAADGLDATEAQALMTALKGKVADRVDTSGVEVAEPVNLVVDKDLEWYRNQKDDEA